MNNHFEYRNAFRILKGGKISLMVSAMLGSSIIVNASPIDGVVTSGSASISQSGNIININQSTQKASINWQSFSIANGETVNFNQPNSSSITLNRVVGNEKSIIDGALNANGQVWILNSNGVLFGKNASINTSGLLATTKELSDIDFQKGNYIFKGDSSASVVNQGTINIKNSGSVIFASNEVKNSGTIKAIAGSVHLVGAKEYSINLNGNSLVNLKVDKGVLDAMVENSGTIIADGGEIYLTTNAVDELLKGVVNNTGILEANSIDDLTGTIELYAHGGEVQVGRTLEASNGFIETSGKDFTILDDASISAGEWLIDPVDITIDDTLASTIETALETTDVTIQTVTSSSSVTTTSNETSTDGDTTDGDIYVNSDITWSSEYTLTLDADDEIYVNATIENTNDTDGGVYFQAANTTDKVIFDTDGKVIINNINQLQWVNTALNGTYELGSDIDASDTLNWTDGFDPLGDTSAAFGGTFDGNGYVIDGLYINRSSEDYVGLFGYIVGDNASTQISDVGLTNVDITGASNTGGLIGQSRYSIISNSYVEGDVTGTTTVGGLIGTLYYSQLNTSYADVNVSGTSNVGGLVGYGDAGGIINTYALGTVTGTGSNIAGLVGGSTSSSITNSYASNTVSATTPYGLVVYQTYYSSVSNSYYDSTTNTGTMSDSANYAKSQSEILALADTTWSSSIWGNDGSEARGYSLDTVTLPFLINVTKLDNTLFEDGLGTSSDPYTITDWTQLQNINYNTDTLSGGYYYTLVNNLTASMSDYDSFASLNANSGSGWDPIGDNATYFTGTFDGSGYVIDGLYINRPSDTYVGLFGFTSSNSSISNIGLTNINIIGLDDVGALVGENLGDISNSYASGTVFGNYNIGGLLGINQGNISNAYALTNVSGTINVGGLVGLNELAGTIQNTYSSGFASGSTNTGALVGYNSAFIDSSFWNTETSGQLNGIGNGIELGVTGLTTAQMSYGQIFKSSGWDIVVDSSINSSIPILKYDSVNDKYVWAISPLVLSYTLSDETTTYTGSTQSLSDFYTSSSIFGSSYSFIDTSDYTFQVSGSAVSGYTDAGTYSNIKVASNGDFLTIKESGNTNGKLTITPKAITVVADDKTKVYGEANPSLTYVATGLISGDSLGSLSTSATSSSGVGEYTITSSLSNSNYSITYTAGKLTITPKAITVVADDKTKVYGEVNPSLTYSLATGSSLVGSDSLSSLVSGSLSTTAISTSGVGSNYVISTSNLSDISSNYDITFSDGKLTILAKEDNNINKIITPIQNQTAVLNQTLVNNIINPMSPISSQFIVPQENRSNVRAIQTNDNMKMVTLSQLKEANDGRNVRVLLNNNSLISVVDAGINLPYGIDQQFYMSDDK